MKAPDELLFSSDLWLRALESFGSDTHLSVKLFDADERVVLGPVNPTPLFQLFEEKGFDPGIFAECARRCLAQTDNRPAVMESKLYGLAVIGTSLVLNRKIVGAAVAGYALVDFSQVAEVQRLARDAGMKFEQLWQITRAQKPVPQQRLILNGELLQVLGDALLRENYRTRQYEQAALQLEEAAAAVAESQERLRQAAKMEAIGRLAGGLAHDFNNQLHVVSGFADFVRRDPGLSPQSSANLLQIQKATERMSSLTRQLLAYSRQQVLIPETLDLNDAMRDSQSMLQRLIGSDVQMVLRLSPNPLWVRVDRGQLLQVLMNLAINARDSMIHGGELLIDTSSATVRPKEFDHAAGATVEPGQYARLVVTDSGGGIASEVLPHLFEPFFTTKEFGKGTGLGLSTVQGIVMQSQGYVWAKNAPGGGAIFTVLLPLASEPSPVPSRPPRRSGANASPNHGRLLLVDDEETLREMLASTLEAAGFEVLQASHGGEALRRLEQIGGTVDLVISDVVMPVIGGRELAARLAVEHPGLPVVWMSGYPRDDAFGSGASGEDQPFLQKPVTTGLLIETVRQVLDSRVGQV